MGYIANQILLGAPGEYTSLVTKKQILGTINSIQIPFVSFHY